MKGFNLASGGASQGQAGENNLQIKFSGNLLSNISIKSKP